MTNKKVEIGVLIPTYNAEKFIVECIESVLNQSYKPSQIVICDDASQDNTVSILKEYKSKYPDLIELICHEKNIGIPANFNSGFHKMNTEYATINSGDDVWSINKLKNEVELLSDEVQCVYSACALIDEQGNRVGPFRRKYEGEEGNLLFQMLMHELAFRCVLIKLSILQELGFYNEDLEIFEDWQLKIEYLEKVNVAFSSEETVFYRKHPEGISKRSTSIIYYDSLKEVYKNVHHIIEKLEHGKRKLVIQRKNKDLKRYLVNSLRNSNELSLEKKVRYLYDLAKISPIEFLKSAIRG